MMKRILLIALLLISCFIFNQAQNEPATQNDKAERIVQRAIERLGGNRYLNVRTAISRGIYSQYKDNIALLGIPFVDYIVYPDKERTEYKTQGVKTIQTNVGNRGWFFDGGTRTIKDMTEEQINDFSTYTLRTSVESLLRGFWKKDGATLSYVGRREASLGRRNDVVQLKYPDNFTVEFEFASDGLPAKIIYKRKGTDEEEKKTDEAKDEEKKDETGEVKEEVRLAQFVEIDGIFTPYIIDIFRNGKQITRVNFQSVDFNKEVSESLFVKPANIKDLK